MVIENLYDFVFGEFGLPVACSRILSEHQDLLAAIDTKNNKTIDACNVADWSAWSNRYDRLNAASCVPSNETIDNKAIFPATFRLDTVENFGEVTLDIREVHGVASSKANLNTFSSLDDFAGITMRTLPKYVPDERQFLQICLSHDQTTCARAQGSDIFFGAQWGGGIYWLNDGGSHHFAAARLIAKNLKLQIPVFGKLSCSKLNQKSVDFLFDNFEIFVLGDSYGRYDLQKSMREYKAHYTILNLPRQFGCKYALLLHKSNARARRVAELFRKFNAFDLNKYFKEISKIAPDFLELKNVRVLS